jgi:hypothetical protein
MSAAAICAEIDRRRREALERRIESYPRNNPIASDLGPCAREMTLSILHWQEKPLIGPDLKARFERGNLIEDAVLRELDALGLRARVERTPFEIRDKQGRIALRGRIDGFIEWQGREFPMEVKSLDPNIFRRINTLEDFDRYQWTAKYPRQLHAYLYGKDLEHGFFLLDDCTGRWKLIPVALDFAAMEDILRRCEAAVDAVERIRKGAPEETTLPGYHPDAAVCRRCVWFGRLCLPPGVSGNGIAILDAPELEVKLDRRAELEAAADEYDDLDREVKAAVRGQERLVVGNWLVQGKEITRNMKAKEAHVQKGWTTTFERLTPPAP